MSTSISAGICDLPCFPTFYFHYSQTIKQFRRYCSNVVSVTIQAEQVKYIYICFKKLFFLLKWPQMPTVEFRGGGACPPQRQYIQCPSCAVPDTSLSPHTTKEQHEKCLFNQFSRNIKLTINMCVLTNNYSI